jgi:NitT/TauT family transport system substrate-binding protein
MQKIRTILVCLALAAASLLASSDPARTASHEIRIAQTSGLAYLPVYVAIERKLIEKHAAASGLTDVTLVFTKLGSGTAINDAIISGSVDIAMAGVTVLINLWDKTVGRNAVKGMMAISDTPIYFNSVDSRVTSIRDLRPGDRIGMTAGKGTQHALVLQMAAAKEFGWDQRAKLDELTVSISHPDGVIGMLSGGANFKTHATTVPFINIELAHPGIHTILNSYDVVGGRHTLIVAYTTEKWRNENRILYDATYAGLAEAMDIIKADKRGAAELFARVEHSGLSVDEIDKIVSDDNMLLFSPAPSKVMVWADYMMRTGLIRHPLTAWSDVFFDNVYDLPGN